VNDDVLDIIINAHEREEAHEGTPLVLTPKQRERLRRLLIDELGGVMSARIVLERIEREV
jgi:hypothetical protein